MDNSRYGRSRRRPKRPDLSAREQEPAEKSQPAETNQTPPSSPTPDAETPPHRQESAPERKQGRSRPPRGSDKDKGKFARRPLQGKTTGTRQERGRGSRPPSRRSQSGDRKPPARDTQSRTSPGSRSSRTLTLAQDGQGLQFQSIALPVLTVMAGTAFLYYAAPIMVPLVAAVTFAYILSPLVMLLKKAKIPHVVAVLLVMLVGAAASSATVYLIVQETIDLAGALPGYYDTVKGWLVIGLEKYDVIRQSTHNLLPALDESLLQGVSFTDFSGVGGYLFKQLGSFLSSIWAFVLVVLLTLFLLLDQDALGRRLSLALGGDQRVSESIITMINKQLRDFLVVRIATTIALAIVFTAGLILFGVPYAYVWGPLAGVLNLIPYVGAIIGMIPPVIVAAIQTGESATASWYWVLLFFVVVQLLESNVVTPKLVGDKVNLNLLAVLLMTVYWGWLWGALGVLLAVPITGAVKVICSHIEPLRPISTLLGGDPGEVGMAKAR